jgi:hypothetical protein
MAFYKNKANSRFQEDGKVKKPMDFYNKKAVLCQSMLIFNELSFQSVSYNFAAKYGFILESTTISRQLI